MSLLSRVTALRPRTPYRRNARAFRPALYPTLDALEQRTVLSAAAAAAAVTAPAALQSPLQITGATISNLAVTGANTLSGTLNLAANLVDKTGAATPITLPVPVQLSLAPVGTTSVLHLSLQIPDLDLLGLHLRLDNCNGGPVTVDINAIPSSQPGGGLLGDLLGGVSNLLSGSGGLLNLGGLTGNVTSALTNVLDGVLSDLVTGTTAATGGTTGPSTGMTDTIPAGDTELVNLHLGPINADILGLQVTTSQICLNAYADPNGGLLGGLLSSLDNLLNNNGNNAHASQVLVRNVLRDLGSLGI